MRKIIVLGETLAVLTLIMAQIWITGPQNKIPETIALIIVVSSWLSRGESMAALGLLAAKKSGGRRMLMFACLCASLTIVIVKMLMGAKIMPHLGNKGIFMGFIAYFPWAVFQQLVLNGYFAKRLLQIFDDKFSAAIAAGMIFSLTHIPNPLLMLVTLLGGVASGLIFLRMKEKNLYLLVAAQVVVAMAIFLAVPASVHHNLRVGPGFLRWPH